MPKVGIHQEKISDDATNFYNDPSFLKDILDTYQVKIKVSPAPINSFGKTNNLIRKSPTLTMDD